jgi:3-oxoacyl-[acyl-carrier protein] reductase
LPSHEAKVNVFDEIHCHGRIATNYNKDQDGDMDLGISGRRALVWGGNRGLGKACALALAREGAIVTIASRTEATLRSVAAEIRMATGREAGWVTADLATDEGRRHALAACPNPDILVNNAAGPLPGDFREWTREDWIAAIDLLMLGPIEMIRIVVDGMIERRFGRIVNISSRAVKSLQLELGLSNGPRAGLVGFVAGLARQTAQHNVTINTLLPGIFDSDAQRRHVEGLARLTGRPFGELWVERAAQNPARRYGRPEELGDWCTFLCSAQSGFVTGQALLIDGGGYPGIF